MAKEPLKLSVIWEEIELPDREERLAAAFEMLLAIKVPQVCSQTQDLDSNGGPDNDQITNP